METPIGETKYQFCQFFVSSREKLQKNKKWQIVDHQKIRLFLENKLTLNNKLLLLILLKLF